MNIIVTGATGFIAAQIVTDLIAAGHSVTCCVRDVEYAQNLFPAAKIIACDFVQDISPNNWMNRLENIDIVINAVGILYHPNKKTIWAIHRDTPCALFDACVVKGIQKIIQISALGIDQSATDYAKSKLAADDYLLLLPLNAIIVRPSLVYGRGSHGGTSLFRGLTGLPFFTPVPGNGQQSFQPIHLQDLSKAVLQLIESSNSSSIVLNAVGPTKTSLKEILSTLRAWLGFAKTTFLHIPLWLINIISHIGDLIPYSAINTTSYKMMMQNNITTDNEAKKFFTFVGFVPREFIDGVYSEPSTVQDHWHARLYFLKPLLQLSIAFVWLFSAITSIFLYPKINSYQLLGDMGVTKFWQPILLYGASSIDAFLGIATLFGYQLKKIYAIQLLVIIFYSLLIAWKLPYLLLEPFAPIIKNLPILIAILILLALESDR